MFFFSFLFQNLILQTISFLLLFFFQETFWVLSMPVNQYITGSEHKTTLPLPRGAYFMRLAACWIYIKFKIEILSLLNVSAFKAQALGILEWHY